MFCFKLPLRDMRFVLHELLGADPAVASRGRPTAWDSDVVDQTIEAIGQFAQRELVSLNASGDAEGCRVTKEGVATPKGYAEAYRRFVEAGWPTLVCSEEMGGQGAPTTVFSAVSEILYAANPAWTLFHATAHGAYECLLAHASPQQKQDYLPKIVSGEWTATMCLTEAHCGSDLGLLRTRAAPQGDGSYRITGSKIFISGGDHDLAENIVHLVLARLPDAPGGVGGISLFLVPRHLPQGKGLMAEKNGMTATAVEHKMGLHGSATCAMSFEGSVGWLIGRPNEGMRNMFVMMNSSRVDVAVQAIGMGHAAYVSALDYARERLQMRAAGGTKRPDLPADPIIEHADVRRMLLTQRAHVEAARMFAYWLSLLLDCEASSSDSQTRRELGGLIGLLTPVAKAFLSENAFVVANLAIQIHGGHGYVRDHGVEQIVRDIRVAQIYEGTSGIQARDLLGRKVLGDHSGTLNGFLDRVRGDMRGGIARLPADIVTPLFELCNELEQLTEHLGQAVRVNADEVGAGGWDYLRALGHLTCSWLFARAAGLAQQRVDEGSTDPFYAAKIATARFYFARLLPEARMHIEVARSGAASLGALAENQLFV